MTSIILIVLLLILFIRISSLNTRIIQIEKQLDGTAVKNKTKEQTAPVVASEHMATTVPPKPESQNIASTKKEEVGEEVSGKILGRIGIAAVIIGVAFFLKYAFDKDWIGEAGRVMIGVLGGVMLLALGQYLRKKYAGYSDLLMGGGIGVLYLSLFSAHFFYHLISSTTAGVLMCIVTLLAFAISIVNATLTLAMISTIGGFATPFLASSGANEMVQLFGYLTVLNIGVLGISFFKKWPELILAAYIGTGINFVAWMFNYYSETMLGPTITFVIISFLIFLVASVARAITTKSSADQVNYALLAFNSFSLAILGYVLLEPRHHDVLGFASVGVALIFMVVAFIVNKANPEDKALNIFLPGLAVTFLSVAVPLHLSGPWIAIAWFVESVILYFIASFIGNRGFQVMGVAVYVLGVLDFFGWNFPKMYDATFIPFFNSHFITLILAVVAAYIISYMYYRFGSTTVEIQKRGIMFFVVIANVLSIYALSTQIIFTHNAKMAQLDSEFSQENRQQQLYNTGYDTTGQQQSAYQEYYEKKQSINNRSHTYVSVLWVIYAAILTAIGFGYRLVGPRRLGLILFLITAFKVISDVWSLGQLYRIISFIVFGVIALIASFAYVKYKDRLKQIV